VSDFLVSPSQETAWRIEPDEFVPRLRERWPDVTITTHEPGSLAAVTFELPVEGTYPPRGELMSDGQVVGLEGGLRESAEVAAWVREIVPAQQELIFYDQGYHFHVPLTDGITAEAIAAAAQG
jgi:hypothetical protein